MTTATSPGQKMSQSQSNVRIVTPSPESLTAVLLADGQWHNIQNGQKVQFAVTESHSPSNPDKLYPALLCEEDGAEVAYPFSQIIGYSTDSQQRSRQQGSGQSSQFGTTNR